MIWQSWAKQSTVIAVYVFIHCMLSYPPPPPAIIIDLNEIYEPMNNLSLRWVCGYSPKKIKKYEVL